MVKDIEEVKRQFCLDALSNVRCLAEAHVEIPEPEPTERVIASIVSVCCDERLPELLNGSAKVVTLLLQKESPQPHFFFR